MLIHCFSTTVSWFQLNFNYYLMLIRLVQVGRSTVNGGHVTNHVEGGRNLGRGNVSLSSNGSVQDKQKK